MNTKFWKISTFISVSFLVFILAISFIPSLRINVNKIWEEQFRGEAGIFLAKPVLAEEIYPLFFCPCCGQPLDKKNICCEQARERIDYINFLVETETSQDDIILAYVKKYGLNSFVDENKQEEVKDKLIASAPADRPVISLTPETYDFRDISQKAGNVFTYFDLKNEGKTDLTISRLETSCGCTFAAIIFQGKESPYFTMPGHGYENPDWGGVVIPAGGTAQLKIMYDPSVHPDFRGFAIREIYVFSNDPINFEKKVKIELNQVD